jgi:hypothetical protein
MRKMENNVIGIDQGDVVLFSDFEHDGEMWTGDGSRNTRMTVAFSEKYIDRPVVYVSVSMLRMRPTYVLMCRPKTLQTLALLSCFGRGATQRSPAVAWRGSQWAPCAPMTSGIFKTGTYLRRLDPASYDRTGTKRMCHSMCSGSLGQTSVRLARCGYSGNS